MAQQMAPIAAFLQIYSFSTGKELKQSTYETEVSQKGFGDKWQHINGATDGAIYSILANI